MNDPLSAFSSPVFPGTTSTAEVGRESSSRLSIILISGALWVPGTSSAETTRVWDGSFEPAGTASSTAGDPLVDSSTSSSEPTRRAVAELRRVSGLTWEQLGELFGVSRRSVHFWASGKPLNAGNEERLMRVLELVRWADRGDSRSTRAALFEARDGVTAFSLLAEGRLEEARGLLGPGSGRPRPARVELSSAARAARAPLPPEELVDARHDRVHGDPGRARAARTVRNTRRGTA